MRPWRTDPAQDSRWFGWASRIVVLALALFGGLSLVLIEYMLAVFWFEGRNQRHLARQGIVSGGDALNQAVLPAFWLTLALVAVQAVVVVILVRRLRARSTRGLRQNPRPT